MPAEYSTLRKALVQAAEHDARVALNSLPPEELALRQQDRRNSILTINACLARHWEEAQDPFIPRPTHQTVNLLLVDEFALATIKAGEVSEESRRVANPSISQFTHFTSFSLALSEFSNPLMPELKFPAEIDIWQIRPGDAYKVVPHITDLQLHAIWQAFRVGRIVRLNDPLYAQYQSLQPTEAPSNL